jgi:hypothetical protein
VADVDGDGKPDLVGGATNPMLNIGGGLLAHGNGDGTFAAFSGTGCATNNYIDCTLADIDGDGKLDIFMLGNFETVWTCLGNGAGSFTMPTTAQHSASGQVGATGKFDKSGRTAVVTLGKDLNINMNQPIVELWPNGVQNPAAIYTFPGNQTVAPTVAGDFNGDGKLDLFSGDADFFIGNGDGTFQAPVSYPALVGASCASAGDFNGDGKLDLALCNNHQVLLQQ